MAKIIYSFGIYYNDFESELNKLIDKLKELEEKGVIKKWAHNVSFPWVLIDVDREISDDEVEELRKRVIDFYKNLAEKIRLIKVYK